jgi:hypothetical protein
MSESDVELKAMVEQAAGVVAASANKVGIKRAMELIGFSEEERGKMTLYQQVRRRSAKLIVVEKNKATPPPSAVNATENASAASDLTGSTHTRKSATNQLPTTEARRRLLVAPVAPATPCSPKSPEKSPVKAKHRGSSKEVQRIHSASVLSKNRNCAAMKAATRLIENNNALPKKEQKTMVAIVKETNQRFAANITTKTASRYVKDGLVGSSPKKKGPVGPFPKQTYHALKGAYVTFLKLEQAESLKQSNRREMAILVNATVNHGGLNKTRDDLTRKLSKDTADQFDVGKANVQEQRRVKWTTKYNLDIWFSTWKDTLKDLGFAREKTSTDEAEGELFFFPGQMERIGNIDETDGSIDDTTGQRGGRPPMTFHDPKIAGGATAVNKSGYSSTIICGSNAAGEPFPPHFQLKSMAQTDEGQRMSVDWFAHCKSVIAKFGHPTRKPLPCTFGMNEKAGMNSVELEKYMRCSILPLYPDIADVPLQRVIMKVDSGPGRMNVEMLAALRLQGLYLVPGVPNTTGKTQETDQNYGPFKSGFRGNIRLLSQARFEKSMTITVTDLPLLVFGGKCTKTSVELKDAFSDAFSVAINLSCWRKCGAVPLTRCPVHSKGVRSEIAVGEAAKRNDMSFEDPELNVLKQLEVTNHFYCDMLTAIGYDGSHLRKNAPTRSTYVAVTEPHSMERVKAIRAAKSAGQMFYATGGKHLNSKEFFQAIELRKREAEVKVMEDAKKERVKLLQEQKAAVMLIRSKGELTAGTFKQFTLPEVKILLKWKKAKPDSNRKADVVKAYIKAPKPKIHKTWTRGEEAALVKLQVAAMPLKETALGVAAAQMARAVSNNLAQLDEESMATLKTALDSFSAESGDNVI